MKRKLGILSLAIVLVFAFSACSSNNNGNAAGGNQNSSNNGEKTVIDVLNFKIEIVDQLDRMVKEYEDLNPNIDVKVETVGGDADQAALLRARFNSGNEPDIFVNGGFKELDLWLEHLEDLTNEPWAEHVLEFAKEPMTKDGALYGQPLNVEGYGFIYNKDLFAKAGITELPKTIDELEQAAIQLQEAGITPFVNGYGVWWVLGNHLINVAFAQQEDPNAFIKGLDDGTETFAGNQVFDEWFDLVDLTLKYGNSNPLQTDYNTQLTMFANGDAAMTQQGNWMQVEIMTANPDMNMGFLPMPINNNAEQNDKLIVGVPYSWVVFNGSPVKEEAKALLDWMAGSDTGKRYMTEEFKHIPALDNVPADDEVLGQLAADIMDYNLAGKTLSWNWFKFPGGEASSQQFADTLQAYVAGQLSRDEALQAFQRTWDDLNNF